MSGEMKTIVGTCSATEQKPGSEWIRYMIDVPGNKYPIRLDTRDEEVMGDAHAVGAAVATWTYNEVESDKINERSGKPYINRYLEGVEPGGNLQNANSSPTSAAQGGRSGGSEGLSKEEWRQKDRASDKRALTAIAVSALTHTMPADPTDEDLAKFLQRVAYLVTPWLSSVEAVRDGDDVPF